MGRACSSRSSGSAFSDGEMDHRFDDAVFVVGDGFECGLGVLEREVVRDHRVGVDGSRSDEIDGGGKTMVLSPDVLDAYLLPSKRVDGEVNGIGLGDAD